MTESKTVLTRYCREVSNWLPCSGSRKKQILQSIRIQAEIFLEENPDADYAALTARFGTPEEIAASTLEEMGSGDVLERVHIRKRIAKILVVFCMCIATFWGLFLLYAVISTAIDDARPGYFVVVDEESGIGMPVEIQPTGEKCE